LAWNSSTPTPRCRRCSRPPKIGPWSNNESSSG
jgi:hypothetical protein